MPELPEVETVRRGLIHGGVVGCQITRVLSSDKSLRYNDMGAMARQSDAKSIIRCRIEELKRRGKYLLFGLSLADESNAQAESNTQANLPSQNWLVAHLGMSGSFRILNPNSSLELSKHDHLGFGLRNKVGQEFGFIYHDVRRFGGISYWDNPNVHRHPAIAAMGLEPWDREWDGQGFYSRLSTRSTQIKPALLDQSLIAGVGNIYASEALWQASIHPERAANSLSRQEATALLQAIRDVLERAIQAGGSTIDSFRNAENQSGYFQHQFAVYGRKDEPCRHPRCHNQTSLILKIMQGQRSSYYCPQHQI